VDGLRQPGSAFKPFTYLTALSQGYTAATMVLDVETDFGTPYNGVAYVPQNYDRPFHGPMRIRQALGSSYNVPAVEVMSWVGVNNVMRTAHSLGITSLEGSPVDQYGLSLTLGGGEVRLLDMVYAFGVLDNMGTMVGEPVPADEQRLGYRTLDPVGDPQGGKPERRSAVRVQPAGAAGDRDAAAVIYHERHAQRPAGALRRLWLSERAGAAGQPAGGGQDGHDERLPRRLGGGLHAAAGDGRLGGQHG
jgi:hypothetical protein